MMKLSISKCSMCAKVRLVDKVQNEWICFACKQTHGKSSAMRPERQKILAG